MSEFAIRPITEAEFSAWREQSLETYAREKEKEGLSATDAKAEAEASFQRHLGNGRNSPNHYVYSVTSNGSVVGTLWWGTQKHGTKQVAWIYDIVLDPAQRGKGLGRKTMEWAMADARAKGFDRLGLHVFGHNKVAQGLYQSLGFEITNLVMYKSLS